MALATATHTHAPGKNMIKKMLGSRVGLRLRGNVVESCQSSRCGTGSSASPVMLCAVVSGN